MEKHDGVQPSVAVDHRPWGMFERYCLNENVTVKIISVEAGQRLSLQWHHNRDELWVAIDDGLTVQIDDDVFDVPAGEKVFVKRGQKHRVIANSDSRVRFLEVAFGHFDEGDIERLEDEYGRV